MNKARKTVFFLVLVLVMALAGSGLALAGREDRQGRMTTTLIGEPSRQATYTSVCAR